MASFEIPFKRLFSWPKVKLITLVAGCLFKKHKGKPFNVNQLHEFMYNLAKKGELPYWRRRKAPSLGRVYLATQELINEHLFHVVKEIEIGRGKRVKDIEPTEDAQKIYRWLNGSPEVSPEIFVMSLWQATWEATVGRLREGEDIISSFIRRCREYKDKIDMLVLANLSGWGLANFLSEILNKEVYPIIPAFIDLYGLTPTEEPSLQGKRVALVDFNILSGGTMTKSKETVMRLGGKPIVGIVVYYFPKMVKTDIGLPIITMLEAPWPFTVHLSQEKNNH